jgi:hypothetical protein
VKKYVRVVAEPSVDNPTCKPIHVDLVIDDAGSIVGKHSVFGVQGDFNRKDEQFCPFVLDLNGKVDYGDGYGKNSSEQYAKLDLRDGLVEVGRILHLTSESFGPEVYKIRQVLVLAQ